MTNPHLLRASAALWSLRAALDLLNQRAREEDWAIAEERRDAAEPLHSPAYGRRTALGGHGDPTADAAGTLAAPRTNRWAELQREVWGQLRDVAEHLPGLTGPLDRLQAAVPVRSDRMAVATARLADRIDGRIRRLLGERDDRQLVPQVPCPGCDTVGLVLRTSAPPAERVIECTTCDGAWSMAELHGKVDA